MSERVLANLRLDGGVPLSVQGRALIEIADDRDALLAACEFAFSMVDGGPDYLRQYAEGIVAELRHELRQALERAGWNDG